jgi:phytoene synthase
MAEPVEDLEDTIRRADPDRWLASRFIEEPQARADVIALYAFDHVLARVQHQVSEPLMGEIRLIWWSEALDEIYDGRRVRSHPVALALAAAVGRHGLDRAPLQSLIDARLGDLDSEPFADEAAALAYARQTGGALMQAATQTLGAPATLEGPPEAGAAYALSLQAHRRAIGGQTRLSDALTPARARALVAEHLSAARTGLKSLPVAAFPAVAYASFAPAYARGAAPSAMRKQLRLVWATARGAV